MSSSFPPNDPFHTGGQQTPLPPSFGSQTPPSFDPKPPNPYAASSVTQGPGGYSGAPRPSPLAVFAAIAGGGGFLMTAFSLCCCLGYVVAVPLDLAGIILGHVALYTIGRSEGRESGQPLAIVGLGGGYLGLLTFVAMMVITGFSFNNSWQEFKAKLDAEGNAPFLNEPQIEFEEPSMDEPTGDDQVAPPDESTPPPSLDGFPSPPSGSDSSSATPDSFSPSPPSDSP